MSEYQYYEFRAIDRPLTTKEMAELRSFSTRARITPTSFTNDYAWGSFKGDADVWMEKYFDAFLYLANWGTHVLKLRLPSKLLNPAKARQYLGGESASVHEVADKVILGLVSEDEEGGEWVEGEGQLSSLISVRSELVRGDLRALYLGWLSRAQAGELDDNDAEPPVPPGLGHLSASLGNLAGYPVGAQPMSCASFLPDRKLNAGKFLQSIQPSNEESTVSDRERRRTWARAARPDSSLSYTKVRRRRRCTARTIR